MDMASSLVHHPGLATSTTPSGFNTSSGTSDLSGLEGLVNAAAAHDPARYVIIFLKYKIILIGY